MKLRSVVACGALALALTACGEEDEPGEVDASATPTTASTSHSEEPSPTFDPQEETAKEFIRRWIRLDNEMQVSGQTAAYSEVVSQKCRPCQDLISTVEKIYGNGGWIKTKGMTVESIKRTVGSEWVVTVNAAPTEYRPAEGAAIKSFPGGATAFALNIVRDDAGRWVVTNSNEETL